MRSFSSQEDLLDNEHYDLAPEPLDELSEPQESELTKVSTGDHENPNSNLEEIGQPDVSRLSTPPSIMDMCNEQAVRDIADMKARFLAAAMDDQDGEAFCTQVLLKASWLATTIKSYLV